MLAFAVKAGLRPHDPRHPGRCAFEAGIAKKPGLLVRTVIELEDEVEYIIDAEAAIELQAEKDGIILHRLADGKEKTATKDELLRSFRDGAVFDQLELK